MGAMRKVYIHTLGCPKNEVDSEVMAGILARRGLETTDSIDEADLLLVNTCTFIDDAKEESIQAILEAGEAKGKRKLLVTGCLAERYGNELRKEIPEIDGLVGVRSLHRVGEEAERLLGGLPVCDPAEASGDENRLGPGRSLLGPVHTAYLKVAEGCDRPCAFCSIPSFRGGLASRTLDSLEREARGLALRGAKEIVIVGQETTAYGKDLGEDASLATLLDRLHPIEGLRWVRILYAYPTAVEDDLIERLAAGKACRYIDVPIQHVSDSLLRAMRRGTSGKGVRETIRRLREGVPCIAIRTSLLVGFPGESSEDFDELRRYVEETAFDRLGVFRFSPQEGTVAATLPDPVPEEVALERQQILTDLQEAIADERGRALVGTRTEILVDEADEKGVWGRTESDAPEIDGAVFLPGVTAKPGDFLHVRITEAGGSTLIAEPLERQPWPSASS
ncbi:MAG: 30S ribosomal protein S12 methylthiotransferase RimO [Candidatus Eisenbacteria bacterium]